MRVKSILSIIFVRGVLEMKRTLNRAKSLPVSMQASGTACLDYSQEVQTYSGTAVVLDSRVYMLLHFKPRLS